MSYAITVLETLVSKTISDNPAQNLVSFSAEQSIGKDYESKKNEFCNFDFHGSWTDLVK